MTPSEIAELREFISRELQKVHDGLGGVEGRLDGVENRLDGIEGRLDGIEGRLGGVEGRLGGVEGRLGGVEGRIGGVEGELREFRSEQLDFQGLVSRHFVEFSRRLRGVEVGQEEMRSDFKALGDGLQGTNRRLDEFREEVREEFRALRAEMAEGFR